MTLTQHTPPYMHTHTPCTPHTDTHTPYIGTQQSQLEHSGVVDPSQESRGDAQSPCRHPDPHTMDLDAPKPRSKYNHLLLQVQAGVEGQPHE